MSFLDWRWFFDLHTLNFLDKITEGLHFVSVYLRYLTATVLSNSALHQASIVMSNVQLSITEPITEEAGLVTQQGRQHRYPHTCNSSNIDNQVRKPSVEFWLRSTILLSLFPRKTENFEWGKATFPFSQKWHFRCPKRKSKTTFF